MSEKQPSVNVVISKNNTRYELTGFNEFNQWAYKKDPLWKSVVDSCLQLEASVGFTPMDLTKMLAYKLEIECINLRERLVNYVERNSVPVCINNDRIVS